MSPLRGWLPGRDRGADGLEVVVLGSSGTRPGPARACSGLLFRTREANVVVDLGYGASMNLYQLVAPEEIDAVILSHEHPDHCVDLIGLYYALRFHPDGPLSVDVHAPPGTGEFLGQMLSGDSSSTFPQVCRFQDAEPGDVLEIGDLEIRLFASLHVVPTISVRVRHRDVVAAYSADSAGGTWLREAARDADLFVCEATWVGDGSDKPEGVHLTATGAGLTAREAGAKQLLLTHLYPGTDRDRSQAEAAAAFGDDVALAEDGQIWRVGDDGSAT